MMSIIQKYKLCILNIGQTLILFVTINLLFSSNLRGANPFQTQNDSLQTQNDTLTTLIEDKFFIKGKVAYGNGVIVGDAEVTLLDTNEKLIETTRTSRKFLKRFGGGRFRFDEVLPGEYIINVDLGTRVGIQKRIKLKDKNLNMGTIYNVVEFPKYEIADYSDSTRLFYKRIPTEPTEPDSINIRHIIVGLDGQANTVIVDSVLRDSVFYTYSGELTRDSIPIDETYMIYNDYGILIHQSRSMKDRITEVQRRDGYIVFHSGDTLKFDNIFFERTLDSPEVATFHYDDTTGIPKYHSFFDIYKVYTGPSYVQRSVERGFKTSYMVYGSIIGYQILKNKSFNPVKSYLPSFDIQKPSGKSYFPMITSFSFITLGWIGYDWYMDRRSNYFTPKDEKTPFPKEMFVFSLKEWTNEKAQPVIKPIMNSKPVKWWNDRKLRQLERKKAKRKNVFE